MKTSPDDYLHEAIVFALQVFGEMLCLNIQMRHSFLFCWDIRVNTFSKTLQVNKVKLFK